MVESWVFQFAIGMAGFAAFLFFVDSVEQSVPERMKLWLITALGLYTVSIISMLYPGATEVSFVWNGIYVPPFQVWLEAAIMGCIISATWEQFKLDRGEEEDQNSVPTTPGERR